LLTLAATVGPTLYAGYMLFGELGEAVAFGLSLLCILGLHELAHYLNRPIDTEVRSLIFIPVPPPLGTFGAIMRVEGEVDSRMAMAGPLASLASSMLFLLTGSTPMEIPPEGAVVLPSSPFLAVMSRAVYGDAPVMLDALGFAGYMGLLVTALNLAPIGALDGGRLWARLGPLAFVPGILGTLYLLYQGYWLFAIIVVGTLPYVGMAPAERPSAADLALALLGSALFVLLLPSWK